MRDGASRLHYRTCNLCEAMCGIEIAHRDGKVLSIKGDAADPFSRGHICPKAIALQDIHTDPDRLKKPVVRTQSGWEELSWDDAFDTVVDELWRIQRAHGDNAVGVYQGNPTVHNVGSMLFAPPFVRALRTRNRFSATSVDQLPHHFASFFMFGHQLLLPIPDIDRTDFFLMLGANPLASNGSIMTAPDVANRLKALQQRGGRLVVVDPRRSETAALADEHFFIRPGADVLLLLALLHTVFVEDLVRPARLGKFTRGMEKIGAVVADFAPERVAGITEIDAGSIRRLAREFAAARSAVCYGRIGLSTQAFGATCQWLINLLNIVTGNLDRAGGAMFPLPAIDTIEQTAKRNRRGHYDQWRSRVRGLPEFSGELPVAALAEDILGEGEDRIRALVTSAGNPVLSTPNGSQLDRALEKLEFMVSVDIYINETTRHANIILPPACGLETNHYDIAFHTLAVRNTAKYSEALFAPSDGALYDWQIFDGLRERIDAAKGRRPPLKERIFANKSPEKILDLGLRLGPYGVWGGRFLARGGLSLRRLKQQPHGVDLGPLEPCLPQRLFTADQRIALAPEILLDDIARVESAFFTPNRAHTSEFDLALIGRRDLRSNNSWMHNSQRLVKGKARCVLFMHPDDASERNIANGAIVDVKSRTGNINLPVEITDQMMPGVVSIPHGWGHGRSGVQLEIASGHAGVSINDLTDADLVDALSGNAAFSNVRVNVHAIETTAPNVA